MMKLSLQFSDISANPTSPVITVKAIAWADAIVYHSGPQRLDKAISVKDIILSPTQGGLPDEQEETQFYA